MGALKKALRICYAVQVVLIFSFVISQVLVSQGLTSMQLNPWIIPIIYFPNHMFCATLYIISFNKALKEIAPDLYDDLFRQNPLVFFGYKGLGFAFRGNGENDAVNKIRAYARCYYLLVSIISLEIVLVFMMLSA